MLLLPAERVAYDAVGRAPVVGHLVSDRPKLGEELVADARLQHLDRTPFEGTCAQANRAPDELYVMEPKLAEQGIVLGQRLRDHVGVTMAVFRVVDFFDRQPARVQVVRLERLPELPTH